MRITTRLRITSTATIVILVVVVPILVWSIFDFMDAKFDYALSKTIKENCYESASLRDQYFLHHEDRIRLLWEKNRAATKNLLRQADSLVHGERDRDALDDLRKDIEASDIIFHRIVGNTLTTKTSGNGLYLNEELDKRLSSQLLLKAAAILDNISTLEESGERRIELSYQTLIIVISLFAFILAFATILFSRRLIRYISNRMLILQQGAQIIAGGDMQHRIEMKGADEFAELASNINTLSGKLIDSILQLRDQSMLSQAILDSISEGLHGLNKDGNIIFENNAATKMLGWDLHEMVGQPAHKMIHHTRADGSTYPQSECPIYATLHDGVIRHIEDEVLWRKDGTSFPVEYTSTPLKNATGEIAGTIVSFRDITERKRAEDNLRITASVFENSQEAIFISDTTGAIIDVNPAFCLITGFSHDEAVGKNPNILSSGRQDKAFYAKMWGTLNQDKAWRGEIWNRRKSGEIYPELLSISAICDKHDKVLRYVAVFSDISQIKEHEAELRHIANYDALTGIPNRVLLADRMKQAIAQTTREQNLMAVCYLDLDGFKPINDTFGHEVGDRILIEVAKRIEGTIRGGDTVARLGGDEFVVLLLGQNKGEECAATLERLLAAVAHPLTVNDKSCSISASIGVSIFPLDNEDPDTLLRHADHAMYAAKQLGKNRFHIYDPALDRRARSQHEFLKSIRKALELEQFELHYQPKVSLLTKELFGVEALIRWRHPERGLLNPAEFLPLIENTDLDIEIGEWVITTALAQMHHWRDSGLDIEVSINISGYHMESAGFVENLRQQIARHPDLQPGKFQVEVLETVALKDISVVREIIESCGKFGVGFALDDFGTGYSSLTYLSGLPIDTLKIDQSFVRDMLEDKGDMAIVQGIIALARAFNRKTIAEGIETKDQFQALLSMGCELGQGYVISRPLPADQLVNWHTSSKFQ